MTDFVKGQRYLKKDDGRIFVWSKKLSGRKDMREFVPDFSEPGAEPMNLETAESLADKTKEQLCDYAMAVYGKKLDKRETHGALVEQILELQKASE